MTSILFFIKRKKLLKDGTAPVYIRVTVRKTAVEFATGKSIIPSSWIPLKGRVKGNTLHNKQLNAYLDQQEYALHDIALCIQREGKEVSAKEILKKYRGEDKPKVYIIGLYEEHNAQLKKLIGISVAAATYKRHETSVKLFKEFLIAECKKQDIFIHEIDAVLLEKYMNYLMTIRHNNNNTTVKYLRNIGKILQIAISRGIIASSPMEQLQLRTLEVEKEFLTIEELEKLAQTKFAVERLELVKDIFLFCCYTGLAYVDVSNLSVNDITKDNNGNSWIRKARHKTNNMCHIPILTSANAILEKYSAHRSNTGKLLPVLSNQKMNAYLKEIADIAGINKNLTTHCARHSFATTVTLANNVSIENVSKMLGHSNIRMTQHYAKILDKTIANDMQKVDLLMQNNLSAIK